MTTKSSFLIGLVVIIIFFANLGCKKLVPQAEAEKIARKALIRYCKENNQPVEKFHETGIASYPDYSWFFQFKKTESPKLGVDVLVNWNGTSEVFSRRGEDL